MKAFARSFARFPTEETQRGGGGGRGERGDGIYSCHRVDIALVPEQLLASIDHRVDW